MSNVKGRSRVCRRGTGQKRGGILAIHKIWNDVNSRSVVDDLTAVVNSCNSRKRIAKTGRFSIGLRRHGGYIEAEGFKLRLKDVTNVAKRAGEMLRGRWLPESELARMLDAIAASYKTTNQN